MSFVKIPGLTGKVYVPDDPEDVGKKYDCDDCTTCQQCSDDRCRVCRGPKKDCRGGCKRRGWKKQ